MSPKAHNKNSDIYEYIGRVITQPKTGQFEERTGIITSFNAKSNEFVVLWDFDEKISYDNNGQKTGVYEPVSRVPSMDIPIEKALFLPELHNLHC